MFIITPFFGSSVFRRKKFSELRPCLNFVNLVLSEPSNIAYETNPSSYSDRSFPLIL